MTVQCHNNPICHLCSKYLSNDMKLFGTYSIPLRFQHTSLHLFFIIYTNLLWSLYTCFVESYLQILLNKFCLSFVYLGQNNMKCSSVCGCSEHTLLTSIVGGGVRGCLLVIIKWKIPQFGPLYNEMCPVPSPLGHYKQLCALLPFRPL